MTRRAVGTLVALLFIALYSGAVVGAMDGAGVDSCETGYGDVSPSMERNLDALQDRHDIPTLTVPADAPADVRRNLAALNERSGCE